MEFKKFLIVEDNLAIAEMLTQQLGNEGYKLLHASNMTKANWKLKNQRFDLVLMDLMLPDGYGGHLVDKVRSERDHPNHRTPIVLVSGSIDKEVIENYEKKVQGFLTKPWTNEKLISTVKSVLGAKENASEESIGIRH